jgi:hypothetical protein
MQVHWTPVLASTAAAFVLGGLWYSPLLFLKPWLAASGKDKPDGAHPSKVFGGAIACAFLGSTAFCLLFADRRPTPFEGAHMGLLAGAGLVVASFGINYLFSGHRLGLFLVDGGCNLAPWTIVGALHGWLR